jgi:hypothetical protein
MSFPGRQLHLDLREPSVPRLLKSHAKAANDKDFPLEWSPCSTLEELADEIQRLDSLRLLEPTSLPKILRGYKRRPQPQTCIISYAAQAAYERRMAGESVSVDRVALKFFRERERMLDRLANKLRCR